MMNHEITPESINEKVVKDDDLLCESGDRIDNAVFEAIKSIAHDGEKLEWDMSLIGPVNDFIEGLLTERGIDACYPWQDEDECICYATSDRCKYCERTIGGQVE